MLDPEQADLVTYCLRKVVTDGTAKAADIGSAVAGKTGTTQDNRDAWFIGYTPKLTAAVWMGYVGAPGAEVRFMADVHGRAVTGGSFPAEIWAKFMREAVKGVNVGSFKAPGDFTGRELNPELLLPTSSTSSTSSSSTSTSTTVKRTTTTVRPTTSSTSTPSTTPTTDGSTTTPSTAPVN